MNYNPTVVNWVSIENPQSGLFVALSKAEKGAQICLEREVRDKDEQLWDYEAAISTGIFRNKTGFVADMNTRTNELIGWQHHGGTNQKFRFEDGCFIHSQTDDKVWDVANGSTSPGAPLILWPKHGGPNQQFTFRARGSEGSAWDMQMGYAY